MKLPAWLRGLLLYFDSRFIRRQQRQVRPRSNAGTAGRGRADLVPLQSIRDARGCLTVAEQLPFPIRRVYWLHGVDPSAQRGGHAHRTLHRYLVAVAGSFQVSYRAREWKDITLDSPQYALRIPPLVWVELKDFAPGAVCLVLASEAHDERDCIRDFGEFLKLAR